MGKQLVGISIDILLLLLCSKTKQQSVSQADNAETQFSEITMLSFYPSSCGHPTFEHIEFSSRNLAIINSSLDMFHIQNHSTLIHQPVVMILQVPTLGSLKNYLYQVDQFLKEHQGVGWKPMIFLLLSANLTARSKGFLVDGLRNISSTRIRHLDINSEVFVVLQKSESIEVHEIYTVKEQLFVKPVVIKFDRFDIEILYTTIERRRDLEGTLINGVTQDDPTLELVATFQDVNGITKFHSGVAVSYFSMMAEGLNFSMGAVRGTGWISQAPSGTLLGMAEQLQSGEADVLIAYSELLPYRLKGLRFLHPYYHGLIRAFFQQPPPSEIRNIFLQPLQPEVWISLFALWILVIISLKCVYELKGNYILKMDDFVPNPPDLDIPDKVIAEDAFMWGIAAACGQGWHMLPQCGIMKLIMLSGLITYIFSYTAYSAAIVTSLSVYLEPIKTWPDLANSGFKLFGDSLLESSSSFTDMSSRQSSFVPSNRTTIDVMQALKRFSTNEPIAIISVADEFYQVASKSNYTTEFICQVSQVPLDNSVTVKGGMTIAKFSPFKKLFNYQTILIQERGLDARLSSHYSSQYTPNCLLKEHNFDTYTLGINDVFTAFSILAGAFLASTCILVCERLGYTHGWNCSKKQRLCPKLTCHLLNV